MRSGDSEYIQVSSHEPPKFSFFLSLIHFAVLFRCFLVGARRSLTHSTHTNTRGTHPAHTASHPSIHRTVFATERSFLFLISRVCLFGFMPLLKLHHSHHFCMCVVCVGLAPCTAALWLVFWSLLSFSALHNIIWRSHHSIPFTLLHKYIHKEIIFFSHLVWIRMWAICHKNQWYRMKK